MKTRNTLLATGLLAALAMTTCVSRVMAETKVTVGVGHMCCASCQTGAKTALEKVASDVSIEGTNITMTLKDADVLPAIRALRRGGFPANHLDAGTGPVTIGVAHLCCGKCNAGLQKAMMAAKVEGLDTDSMKIGDGNMVVKAKDGMKLDVIEVLAAMEKGGFSANKLTLSATAAKVQRHIIKTASR